MRYAPVLALLLALASVPALAFADTTPPTLTNVTLQSNNTNTSYARVGDSITVNLTGDEDLANVHISILGQSVTVRTFSDPKFYFGSHIVTESDAEGDVAFEITYDDLAGNTGIPVASSTTGSTVRIDRRPPSVSAMSDISVEGSAAGGAIVSFASPAASDTDAGALSASCTPASDTLFALGTTTVTCTARDFAGNAGTASFSVVVTDTTAPEINLVDASSDSVVRGETYTDPGATATDSVDADVAIAVTGSVDTSAYGDYVLTYTATDDSGNSASVSRTVSVVRGSSGGGGGGSSRRSQSGGDVGGGEVLGAAAYNFTRTLRTGDSGNDVLELQKLLQSKGYFGEAPTGYFGPVTAQAVSRYQAAHGLEQVGAVGPRTLAVLNGETVTGVSREAQLALLYAELERILAELKKLREAA